MKFTMGTSFVTADGEHGFWMTDCILELWLRLLALHVEVPATENDVARKIRDQWLLASRGIFGGWVPHSLEEITADDDGKTIVRAAIDSTLRAFANGPESIDKSALNLLGFDNPYTRDVEIRRLIEVGKAFVDLLDGKIGATARDTSFMPGCR